MNQYIGPTLIAFAGLCTLGFLFIILWAMIFRDGMILLDFNRWHEGWIEAGALTIIVGACFGYLWRFFTRPMGD